MDSSSFSNPSSCDYTSAAARRSGKKKKGGGSGKLSTDPQSVAARQRRHRISDRFKILQSLVPGGSKMDTVSMLEQAIQYVKFLKNQIWLHQAMIDAPSRSSLQPFDPQELDLCGDYQLGLPESWVSGEEINWGFDASMQS